jgi:hypothetical protein
VGERGAAGVHLRADQSRGATAGAHHARWPHRAGSAEWSGRTGRDLSGSAQESVRRAGLRALRHEPAGPRCARRNGDAPWPTGHAHRRRSVARRALPAGEHRLAPVFVPRVSRSSPASAPSSNACVAT